MIATASSLNAEAMVNAVKGRSLWADAWRRLKRNRAAMAGIAIKGLLDPASRDQGAVEFSSFTASPVAEPEAGADGTWHGIGDRK